MFAFSAVDTRGLRNGFVVCGFDFEKVPPIVEFGMALVWIKDQVVEGGGTGPAGEVATVAAASLCIDVTITCNGKCVLTLRA